ncbi:copper resistance protein NlpE [Arenimonas fontis]|uniref:Copper resistance protein NlpE n=1 Tax=Arenimonas fontis TaxID=2608255 RepID=A0A5B2Z9L8_9GAMM|nr:copper resistance protein NlpE [Arenimonas fontis]KAA2283970.1 copper resistance protein NlpE [Arenimonas fontis]
MSPVPTSRSRVLRPLLLALLLAACGREQAGQEEAAAGVPGDAPALAQGGDFDRQWFGVLPCADCDGIQTRLRLLREDGEHRFELEERYLGDDVAPAFSQQGRWQEQERGGRPEYLLDPEGARLRLRPLEDGSLELLGPDGEPLSQGPEYRLGRL